MSMNPKTHSDSYWQGYNDGVQYEKRIQARVQAAQHERGLKEDRDQLHLALEAIAQMEGALDPRQGLALAVAVARVAITPQSDLETHARALGDLMKVEAGIPVVARSDHHKKLGKALDTVLGAISEPFKGDA